MFFKVSGSCRSHIMASKGQRMHDGKACDHVIQKTKKGNGVP